MIDQSSYGRSGQFSLPLATLRVYDPDSLVLGSSNHLALELIERPDHWHNGCALIVGDEASGKSHMLEVFARKHQIFRLRADQLYLTYSASTLAVDDVQLLISNPEGQKVLFHLINRAVLGELNILMASRRPVGILDLEVQDLASRLAAASTAIIGSPDETLLAQLLTKHFADAQVEVKPAVIDFIVSRIERSYAAVSRAAAVVNSLALAEKRAITVPLVKEVLAL